MASFFTRKGDDGYTGMLGEGRVPKYDQIMEALGAVDEATAALGVARSQCRSLDIAPIIVQIQRDLYGLMAEIAATPENAQKFRRIDQERVEWLEVRTSDLEKLVGVPKEFIIPGDSPAGAALDLARTIVRRAERRVAELFHQGRVTNQFLLQYLNRLSSLCFVLELQENNVAGRGNPTLARSV